MKKLKILGFFCLFRKEKKISSTFPPHPPPRDFKFWRFYIELKLTFFFHVESDALSPNVTGRSATTGKINVRDAAEVWWQLFIIAAKLFQYNQRWLWIRWTYWRHYSKHTILYIEQRIRIIYVKKSLTKQIKQQSWKKYLL